MDDKPVNQQSDDALLSALRTSLGTMAPPDAPTRLALPPIGYVEGVSTVTYDESRRGRAGLPDQSFATDDWPIPDYEPLRLCGRGAFGQVWIVRDRAGVLRALKILDLRTMRRNHAAVRELEALRRYCRIAVHPHLVSIFHVGQTSDCLYYTMELADNANTSRPMRDDELETYAAATLKARMQRDHPGPDQAVAIIEQLLAGLINLHDTDLAHRDIKPDNVIFVDGVPKLADIGMTTAAEPDTGAGGGTPGYIPPDGRTDATADTYAMSKVLLGMLSWPEPPRVPWVPTALLDPDNSHARRLNEALLRGCAADGDDRFGDAREMRAALEPCRPRTPGRPMRDRGRRTWVGRAAAVLLVVTILVVVAVQWWPRPPGLTLVDFATIIEYRSPNGARVIEQLRSDDIVEDAHGISLVCRLDAPAHVYAFLATESGMILPLHPSEPLEADMPMPAGRWQSFPGPDDFLPLAGPPPVDGKVQLYVVASSHPLDSLRGALRRAAREGSATQPSTPTALELATNLNEIYRPVKHELSPAILPNFWPTRSPEQQIVVRTHNAFGKQVIVRIIEFTARASPEAPTP